MKNPTDLEIRSLYNLFIENKHDDLEKAAYKFIKNFPKFYFGWKILGVLYLNKGLFEKSLAYNVKALDLNAKDTESYFNLALNYQKLGQFELAIKYYHHSLKLIPEYFEAHNNLGVVYSFQKKYQKHTFILKKRLL